MRLISVGLSFCLSFPIFSNNSGAANITVEKNFPDGNGENSFKCILISSEKKEYECKNNNIPLDTSGMQFCTNASSCVFQCRGFPNCIYDYLKYNDQLLYCQLNKKWSCM